MPASAASNRPEELAERIAGGAVIFAAGGGGTEALLKSVREVKNQIIGNKTKKIAYVRLGAVPSIAAVLCTAADGSSPSADTLIVQCVVSLGSFACGLDDGVRAVLDAGAVPHLTAILSHPNRKVVDAGARSLRIIFQSKLAPKYDFLQEKNMRFLLSLLNCANESITELAATIITHSCEKNKEQKALCDAGALQRLVELLKGSLNQRDACLDSIAALVKNNPEAVCQFVGIENGKALSSIIELIDNRNPRTRLLACACLIIIGNASSCYIQELEIRTKLILVLLELLEEHGRVGDEAPFVLMNLMENRVELHQQAYSINAVEKMSNFLLKNPLETKRIQGVLLALSQLCSQFEKSRCQSLSLQILDYIIGSLKHESAYVRVAACSCLKSISRSVKNLVAGHFAMDSLFISMVHILQDDHTSVQVEALGAICNIVVTIGSQNHVFIELGGLKELVRLSKSADLAVRLNSVGALGNLAFLADKMTQEDILMELTESTLVSLINDPEASVQEQALALVRNLAGGFPGSIDRLLGGTVILDAVARQIHCCFVSKVCTQGMFFLSNVSTGMEIHKDAVLSYLLTQQKDGCYKAFVVKLLESNDNLLRTATTWCIINLTKPDSHNASSRASRLSDAGVISKLKYMAHDSCIDVKYRAITALQQFTVLGFSHA